MASTFCRDVTCMYWKQIDLEEELGRCGLSRIVLDEGHSCKAFEIRPDFEIHPDCAEEEEPK